MASKHGKRYADSRYRHKLKHSSSGGHVSKRRKVWFEIGPPGRATNVEGPRSNPTLPTPQV